MIATARTESPLVDLRGASQATCVGGGAKNQRYSLVGSPAAWSRLVREKNDDHHLDSGFALKSGTLEAKLCNDGGHGSRRRKWGVARPKMGNRSLCSPICSHF